MMTGKFYYNQRANTKNIPLSSTLRYFINPQSEIGITYNQQLSFYYQKGQAETLNQFGAQVFYDHSNIWKRVALHSFIRKQVASIGDNPLTYGAKLSRRIGRSLSAYVSYNTNYRLPTLNELYYFPGGNENLKPELARNVESGAKLSFYYKKFLIKNTTSIYSRYVKDWVIWTGAAIFFPDNIAEVWSRGVESNTSVRYKLGKIGLRNDFLLGLNRSAGQKAHFVNDLSVGRQIPYVPKLTWRNNLYATYKNYSTQLHIGYTGYRFITRDESEYVDPYMLVNLYFGLNQPFSKKLGVTFQLKLNNILNEHYESMRGRIMPGRNLAFSIILKR